MTVLTLALIYATIALPTAIVVGRAIKFGMGGA